MKKFILFAILLTMPCVSLSQITNPPGTNDVQLKYKDNQKNKIVWKLESDLENYDSLKISPSQVFNIYVGLKRLENVEKELARMKELAKKLNKKIQKQNTEQQKLLDEITELNNLISQRNEDLVKKEGEIEKLKSKTKRFSIGPSAGLNYNGKIYAGFGINYELFRF